MHSKEWSELGLVQVSLNQKVDDWMVTQPPIPLASSAVKASAAA